jgi:hypothetical protein
MHSPAESPGVRFELAGDPIASLRVGNDDEMLRQSRRILVEAPHFDRAPRAAARREEPMTVGQRARFDVEHLRSRRAGCAADGERDHAAAVEKQQPANRAAEQKLPPAVVELRVPVHLFGKRQIAQQADEQLGQRVDRALAALTLLIGEVFAFRGLEPGQAVERHPLLLGKSEPCRRRVSVGTNRRRHRGDR